MLARAQMHNIEGPQAWATVRRVPCWECGGGSVLLLGKKNRPVGSE